MGSLLPADKYVLGIDIGGKKILAQLFRIRRDEVSEQQIWSRKEDTRKGLPEHIAQVTGIIENAEEQVKQLGGALIGIGIGSPGRFDKNGVIKTRTNTNVGKTPGEFDGINLKSEYIASLSQNPALKDIPLIVNNDAAVVLGGMLRSIQKDRALYLIDQNGNEVGPFGMRGKHVAMLGIGTGLGHAVAKMDKEGRGYTFVTDGHASKLRVKVDAEDWHLIEKAKFFEAASHEADRTGGYVPRILCFDDNTVRAADLFSGTIINKIAGVHDGCNIRLDNPDHLAAIKFAGKYMARTMQLIRSGESTDVEPANSWSAADKQEAAKTSIYLVGGGMGGSPLGAEIIKYAKKELGPDNANIKIIHMNKKRDAWPAAVMASEAFSVEMQTASAGKA